ncbi:unnamed protein product [Alopecurus aequalis]
MGSDDRSMGKPVAAHAAAELPDELLLEIFARVAPGILDLLRCAGTCTRWFRLIADPAFLRRAGVLPENAPRGSFLIGAFQQYANLICRCKPLKLFKPDEPPQFTSLYRAPRPSRGVAPRLGFTSFLRNTGGLFDYAEPLTSRRGLLLLRIMPRPMDPSKLHLAVCHPLIGEQATHLLPPPPLDLNPRGFGHDVTGYTLLTSADLHNGGDLANDDQRPTFRVILTVVHSDDKLVHVYSYSSATGSWSPPIKCPQTCGLMLAGQRDGVVTRGTVHWVYMDQGRLLYTLDVSADAANVSLTRTPIQVREEEDDHGGVEVGTVVAYAAGGNMSIAINPASRYYGTPEFWTKREQDNVQNSQVDSGYSHLMRRPELAGTKILAFAESKGAMIVQRADRAGLFTLDLESTEMEPVKGDDSPWGFVRSCSSYRYDGCSNITLNNRVLYEMDWPSYLRLTSRPCVHDESR